jgi:UMP-CMP kinase
MEVTIQLLSNAMRESMEANPNSKRFLVDGFPRQMDQAVKFDESVRRAFTFFGCRGCMPEEGGQTGVGEE